MKLAVVIPCFKVKNQILGVLSRFGPEIDSIYVVDDACPEHTGAFVSSNGLDPRVRVLSHPENQGVGGAVITGYVAALEDGADVIIKVDGDGQMDPALIPTLIKPILEGRADYAKGNRFDSLEDLFEMPRIRILGNAVLSLWSKVSTGYWTVNDPTNGFTAIHRRALEKIHLGKIRRSYFFESDILFRLSIANAVVADVPMKAVYGEEKSNLRISRVLIEFPWRHTVNLMKRIFYRYYLREWSIASLELPLGLMMLGFGGWFGLHSFMQASADGRATTAGQVTLAAIGIILGVQLLLSFLAFDIQAEPKAPTHRR
ncbi:MAG: hypothetical protein RIS08_1030 [Actinomycetota bacterium]|jgi:glycosyltransferase involved in cell wall biosynthesis